MNKETREALDESIKHWELLERFVRSNRPKLVEAEGWHCESCALCDKFLDSDCEGFYKGCSELCPVKAATGEDLCEKTPWADASDALHDFVLGGAEMCDVEDVLRLVRGQVEFLKLLRK